MRCLTLLFSLCLHGIVTGILFLFSTGQQAEAERVYHVALAEFVQPGIVQEVPTPETPTPIAEVAPPPPPPLAPEAETEPSKEPASKVISTIKPTPPVQARPATKPAPPVARPSA